MKNLTLILLLVAVLFSRCAKPEETSSESSYDVSHYDILTYTSASGDTLVYTADVMTITRKDDKQYYHHYSVQNLTQDTADVVSFEYDRYDDGNNWYYECTQCKPYYAVSPDKASFFTATRVNANSNGWTTEYQLYRVDCATATSRFIGDFAAIMVTEEGFVCADARLTNRESSTCTADEIWMMHDVHINWLGHITRIDTVEYDYETMARRFATSEYTYLKGFASGSVTCPELQEKAESLLSGYKGCIIAIEPATGKVLAMACSPNDSINRCTQWKCSPGTPIKMLIPLICLQDGVITEEQYNQSAYQCAKAFLEPDSAYENNHAIFYQRYELMSEYLRSLGLGVQYDESDFPHASGNIPSSTFYDKMYGVAGWKAITIRSNFIGQGEILTTPLQLANLAAIIANEGWYIAPHISCSTSATVHRSMIDEKWFRRYKKYMSDMVTCGDHNQLYVGFAPVENPKIAISIVINEPDTTVLNARQLAKEIYNFQ